MLARARTRQDIIENRVAENVEKLSTWKVTHGPWLSTCAIHGKQAKVKQQKKIARDTNELRRTEKKIRRTK